MTNKKSKHAIARIIILALSIVVITLTFKTICIGIDLASISEQNSNTETWRISGTGINAANSVYENNMILRDSIYNSPSAYTRWISTSNKFVQLIVGFSLVALSFLSCYIWYTYISMKTKKFRRRVNYNKQKRHSHIIRQTT